jgi:hypothetical protein
LSSFSFRRFAVLLVVLAIGVGIGAGLERAFNPPLSAPEPVAPMPAPVAAVVASPPPAAAPETLRCEVRMPTFANHLYPSLMLSCGSAYPEFTRNLTIAIHGATTGQPYQLQIDSNLFQRPLTFNGVAASAAFEVTPVLPWNYEALRRVNQLRPETFVAAVTQSGRGTAQATLTGIVHPVNEVVSRIYDPEQQQWRDTSICYAAFVNEDHPWITQLLQEALAGGGVAQFNGYGFGREAVIAQLQSVWNALGARGLNYVDVATTSGGSPNVTTQYVRFLDQSVRDQGANCVDASVLLASIFRRIGLRPVLLFKPGHCFVAVYDAAEGGSLIPVETTVLNAAPFASALAFGTEDLANTVPYLDTPGYGSVDIVHARQVGVKPIEFAGP